MAMLNNQRVYSLIIYIICVMETFPSAHGATSHPEFHFAQGPGSECLGRSARLLGGVELWFVGSERCIFNMNWWKLMIIDDDWW